MGCDITIVIECRKNGQWEVVPWYCSTWPKKPKDVAGAIDMPECFEGRNYTIFGILAGVRDWTVTPIAEPRGFPSDLSFPVNSRGTYHDRAGDEQWFGEHSFSWVSLRELEDYYTKDLKDLLYREGEDNWFEEVLPVLRTLGGSDNVRIVFGFDS